MFSFHVGSQLDVEVRSVIHQQRQRSENLFTKPRVSTKNFSRENYAFDAIAILTTEDGSNG